MPVPSQDQVTEALRSVIDPELRRSIVELEMVRSIDIHEDGRVDVVVSLTTPGCPIRAQFERAVVDNVGAIEGVTSVGVGFDVLSDQEKQGLQQKLGRPGGLPEGALAKVKNVICVASGKGGVGKSTMTANLAAALTAEGKSAGALDCDVYGYSIPRMLGVNSRPEVNAERKIIPLESPSGVKVMSIGFFVEENAAVVWRGPMLHKAIQQFLEDVEWGELDYLLLDLPPGTGDVHLTLAQIVPLTGAIIVTTPQDVAKADVIKSIAMFQLPQVNIPIIGIVENMSYFIPSDMPNKKYYIFGQGAGEQLAKEYQLTLLAQLPIEPSVAQRSDSGVPAVMGNDYVAKTYQDLAQTVARYIAIKNEQVLSLQNP